MHSEKVPYIQEIGEREFEKAVLEQSRRVPVVVDFMASWCAPCRQLGPVLERLAHEYGGRFVLVKVDIDQNPYLAMSLAVEVVPTVMAFKDGHLVGRFHGALSEEQVRHFLDGLVPSAWQTELAQVRELLGHDARAALARLDALRQSRPDDENLAALRAVALAELGRWSEALEEARRVTEGSDYYQEAANVLARATFREEAEQAGGLAMCQAQVQAHPDDAQAHYRLGICLAAAGRFAEALESLLRAGELQPSLAHGPVRETMVRIFNLVGPDSELANTYRSRLAALLY
ncbi:MAG: tetratricopeptide repeat protein [Gemmatales bacterium]|nr:tetratricopeptide repeat protein [Gemmatales bacterium]MDW8221724.1 tetratricopeptide repeat protein [Gemmatales bacterium]